MAIHTPRARRAEALAAVALLWFCCFVLSRRPELSLTADGKKHPHTWHELLSPCPLKLVIVSYSLLESLCCVGVRLAASHATSAFL